VSTQSTSAVPPALTAQILWGGFVLTHLVLAGVGWLVHGQGTNIGLDHTVVLVLGGVGIATALAGSAVERVVRSVVMARLRGGAASDAEINMGFLQPRIVRLAFADVGAMTAFVVIVGGAEPLLWVGCVGVALLAALAAFPSGQSFADWRRSLGAA
jgi:hypothetical protein